MDLRDLLAEEPTTTPTLVLALIEEMPMSTRTSALLRDSPESVGWSTSDYLTAALIDSVRDGTFANMQMNSKKKLQPFERVPIPGVEKKPEKKPVNNFVRMARAALVEAQKQKE